MKLIAYKDLYGVVPLDEKMKRQTLDQARLILKKEFLPVILDKDEQVVGFGLCMPSITKALVGSSGKLSNPVTLIKVLRALYKPEGAELLLVGFKTRFKIL